jgi:CubicO group peptidase (beta-lactamase class C family)
MDMLPAVTNREIAADQMNEDHPIQRSAVNAPRVKRSAGVLLLTVVALQTPVHASGADKPACADAPAVVAKDEASSTFTSLLDAHLKELTKADQFSGTVLVARHRRVIFAGAYGCADRERRLLNTADTRFRIGSMNKMFTAVAVLQLVEAGKIGLGDPVGRHLKHYPNQDFATKVTIRELLTHTGGAGDIFGKDFDTHRLELRDLSDYAKLYGTPGAGFCSRQPILLQHLRLRHSRTGRRAGVRADLLRLRT